jgi:hypothetical protein
MKNWSEIERKLILWVSAVQIAILLLALTLELNK